MKIDGKQIAADVYADLSDFFKTHQARLGILVAGNDPVIEQFVRIKSRAAQNLGVGMARVDLPAAATTEQVIEAVQQLQQQADAIIVQLPLPAQVDANAVLSSIAPGKDADAINPRHSGEHFVEAPVASAIVEILQRANVSVAGKRAVVVGSGRLVGAPAYDALKKRGADVSFFTLDRGAIVDLKDADIVVSGAGQPGFIKPEHLKPGVALIDAGTSEQGSSIVGDADPACEQVASVFTPVPGGVGPIAVAMIFKNLKTLIEHK